MAANSRPPSEQGVEYDLLDELRELRPLLEQLRNLPARAQIEVVSNWFDRLPRKISDNFRLGGAGWSWQSPPIGFWGYPAPSLYLTGFPDHVDLQLRDSDGLPSWSRTLLLDDASLP